MNRELYTLLLYILAPIIWFYFIYRGIKDTRYFKGLTQRLGFFFGTQSKGRIHIHCASVGEVRAALPLLVQILDKYSQLGILITTTTPTGKEEVQKFINSVENPECYNSQNKPKQVIHAYLPIDWPGACKRFIKKFKLKLSILIETELWPNLINQLHKQNTPIILANARLSSHSLKKYLKHPSLSKNMFKTISKVTAQYESDKQNFEMLGVGNDKMEVIGNIKFDIELSEELLKSQQELKKAWTKGRPSWIAASIHPAEFRIILNTHKQLLKQFPNLILVAVPRHPERFNELKAACETEDLNFISRTDQQLPKAEHSVIVGDTMGELTLMYGAVDIAFVGGSLIERGGHNPIEPAACGLPVIMGPSYYNFYDVTKIMQQQGALSILNDHCELLKTITKLLSNEQLLTKQTRATYKAFESNRGAVNKIIKIMEPIIDN